MKINTRLNDLQVLALSRCHYLARKKALQKKQFRIDFEKSVTYMDSPTERYLISSYNSLYDLYIQYATLIELILDIDRKELLQIASGYEIDNINEYLYNTLMSIYNDLSECTIKNLLNRGIDIIRYIRLS